MPWTVKIVARKDSSMMVLSETKYASRREAGKVVSKYPKNRVEKDFDSSTYYVIM